MAAKKSYLFSVRRVSTGALLSLAAVVETARPGDVKAQHLDNGQVRLVYKGDVLATSTEILDDDDERFQLVRWVSGQQDAPHESDVEPRA